METQTDAERRYADAMLALTYANKKLERQITALVWQQSILRCFIFVLCALMLYTSWYVASCDKDVARFIHSLSY